MWKSNCPLNLITGRVTLYSNCGGVLAHSSLQNCFNSATLKGFRAWRPQHDLTEVSQEDRRCKLCRVQVSPHAVVTLTPTKSKLVKNSLKRWVEKTMSVASTCKPFLFRGRLIVAHLVHLLFISLTPKQLNLINNPLCYWTDQINITGV